MTTSLDVLRRAAGTEAGPDLVVAVAEMPQAELDQVAQRLLHTSTVSRVAPPTSEVWPVVTMRSSTFASGGVYRDARSGAGLDLSSALNPRLQGTGFFSDAILRALLYCHGLVIEDPVIAAADLYLGTSGEVRQVARLAMTSAVTAAVEIAPLIDGGVIRPFFGASVSQGQVSRLGEAISEKLGDPKSGYTVADAWEAFEASYVDGLAPSLRQLWARVRAGDRSPPLDLVEAGVAESDVEVVSVFIDVLKNLHPQAVVDNAAEIVASALLAVEQLGGYDLMCPSPMFAKMLFLGAPDPASELRLHELARTPVPGIVDLSAVDAVAIRQQSEAFATWRTQLSDALGHVLEVRDGGGSDVDVKNMVRDTIAEARAALHREARRSRVLSGKNALVFVAGGLGGAVAGAPGGAAGSAFGAAGGALGPLVAAVLGRTTVPRYLDRHYLVFEPTEAPRRATTTAVPPRV